MLLFTVEFSGRGARGEGVHALAARHQAPGNRGTRATHTGWGWMDTDGLGDNGTPALRGFLLAQNKNVLTVRVS